MIRNYSFLSAVIVQDWLIPVAILCYEKLQNPEKFMCRRLCHFRAYQRDLLPRLFPIENMWNWFFASFFITNRIHCYLSLKNFFIGRFLEWYFLTFFISKLGIEPGFLPADIDPPMPILLSLIKRTRKKTALKYINPYFVREFLE